MVALASVPILYADVTYLPVTDKCHLDYQSTYVIAAKDYDVITSKSKTKLSRYGLSEIPVTRNEDGSIIVAGSTEEHASSRFNLWDSGDDEYPWKIYSEVYDQPLVTTPNYDLFLRDEHVMATKIDSELININDDGSVDIKFKDSPRYFLRYYESDNWFRCAKKSEYSSVVLYRQDEFAFRIDESNDSADEVILTSSWEPNKYFKDVPLEVRYMFNDGSPVNLPLLIEEGYMVESNDGRDISIPRGEGSVLWVLGVYEPRYIGNDDFGNEFFRYSNVFKFEVALPENKITGSEHFTQPRSDGYKFKEQVEFIKDSDVKIYYSIDGSDPVILGESGGEVTTFDIDVVPIVYYGDTIDLKFVAVKDGYEPTEIMSLTITGEPKPVTTQGEHFELPENKRYEIDEPIIFKRESDVKIYYTLDGLDPVIPASGLSAFDGSEDERGEHNGITYDLDEYPLSFNGSQMTVMFVAVKQYYAPSKVQKFSINMSTSSVEEVLMEDNQPSEYYNIQGTRVMHPLRPGLYIEKKGTKVSKVVIR